MKQRLTSQEAFAAYDIELNPEFPTYDEILRIAVATHSLASDLVTLLSRDGSNLVLLGMAKSIEYLADLLAVQIQNTNPSDAEKTITD